MMYDVMIIGGGIAGLTASIYAARAGYKTILFEGEPLSNTQLPGGQLMLTPEIENYPGFTGSGDDLIESIQEQAMRFGVVIVDRMAYPKVLNAKTKILVDSEGEEYAGLSCILATGSVARRLNVPNEDEFFGRGVSVCATCDGAFYKDKDVVVIGGGHVAVEDALYLTNIAKQVHVIHRRDKLRAQSPEAEKLLAAENVVFHWEEEVSTILAGDKVTGVFLKSGKTVSADGVFIAIGHDPDTEAFAEIVSVDEYGYFIKKPGSSVLENVPGVFVAGDAADAVYKQAVTAAGTGCMAALDAQHYLNALR